MTSLFLVCDGIFNAAIVPKASIEINTGTNANLFLDGNFTKAITVDNLLEQAVLDGINQIADADFSQVGKYWLIDSNEENGCNTSINFNERWTLYNNHTFHIYQKVGFDEIVDLVYHDPIVGQYIPVNALDYYQFSASFGLHRCHGIFILEFYDNQKQRLKCCDNNVVQGKLGGNVIEDYQTVNEIVQAPKNAAFAKLIIKKFPTPEGKTDSFLFVTCPLFALAASATAPLAKWHKSPFGLAGWEALRKANLNELVVIQFALPEQAYDGQTHSIELKTKDSGQLFFGSPRTFTYKTNLKGQLVRLDGNRVIGWVSQPETLINLYVDDQLVAEAQTGITSESEERYPYSFALPTDYLDGRPHRIDARVRITGQIIGELAEITPYTLTTWDVLQKYASTPLPAKLSPAAKYRYESMRASLLALSEAAKHKKGQAYIDLIDHISNLGALHDQLVNGFEKPSKFLPLKFPSHEQPEASIIVPVHNKFAVTYNCLAALLFAYNHTSFEVILVDDGSSDETLGIPQLVEGITYIRNETAQGFIRSCNRGAEHARGKYIVMLNNDTEPTVRWLDELVFTFKEFADVGLAGSKLLYPDGKLQEAGGIVWNNSNPWNYGRGANPNDPRFNYSRQVDYLSGASIMLLKSVWDEVGGFGEEYCPAYFEDTDLAFKVRAAGYKTVYAPLSVVYHFEGISSGTDVSSGTKRFQEINRPKFKQKWIHHCRFNGEEGKDVDLNKDRGISLRALVIDYQTPRTDIDAGSYAALQEMRLLQSLGFKVTFVPENFIFFGGYTEALQRLGIEVLYSPFAYNMQEFMQKRGEEFDVVYITRYYVAKNHLNLVRQYAPQAKVLFCNADLHFLRELREAIEFKDKEKLVHAATVRDNELGIMREVDVTLSYNAIEHAVILSHNENQSKVVTCPWVVDVIDNVPGFAERTDIAFLGGFGHPPNKAAAVFFINQVMPILRHQLPGAAFKIYGSNIPDDLKKLQSQDVIVAGYIENVADVYNACRVFVAPLQTGAGIKGKVIDALAHGIPSVLSPIAAEGTQLRHELEVLIAETAQEWADAVTKLYKDQITWEKTSKAAQSFASQHYSFENGRKLMRKALETVDVFAPADNQALVSKRTRTTLNG